MEKISMIGLDLAKCVFQIHGIDAAGKVVLRRQLRRGQMEKFFAQLPPTVVGMEACSGAHHWARAFQKRMARPVRKWLPLDDLSSLVPPRLTKWPVG
jgi:transposase